MGLRILPSFLLPPTEMTEESVRPWVRPSIRPHLDPLVERPVALLKVPDDGRTDGRTHGRNKFFDEGPGDDEDDGREKR